MTKLCLIKTNKIVPELYNMSGPFFEPVTLTTEQITSMLNRGVLVYEVNPYNRNEKIRLTRFLANQVNFKKPVVKSTTPVVPTSAPVQTLSETASVSQMKNNKYQKHNQQKVDPTKVKIADFR